VAATIIGLAVGLLIGAGCRYFDIPSPAPPRLIGACLLVAMTLGFVAADYILSNRHILAATVSP
jgi:XapX domain-containing protein